MRSVADDLRRDATARVLALPVAARLALALSLGDEDLMLFARANGLPGDAARARLPAHRAIGRTPSVANASRS